ncbi:MAG TPA: alkylhydroperoxidase [Gammaproteobacteria bacterium]|jgi:uncharacterized peroxidase-related enzyme|nr:alkylhydroperoxidase [Gammaproteobacteria bacterium]
MAREKRISLNGIHPDNATGRVKELFDTAQAKLGFVPNMYTNMANTPALLDTYMQGYQLFREHSQFSPQEQEVVFLAISYEHHCEYCVSAHSLIADKMSDVSPDTLKAIRAGETIPNAKLAALDTFTRVMIDTRGNPSAEDIATFRAAGYSDQAILDIVLALSVKVISNYANHLFATPLDDAFAAYTWPEQ